MRRHVVGMSGRWGNLGVQSRRGKALFSENRIVVAMNDVVRDARMVGILGEEGFEDFPAAALIRKGLVGFGSGDVQRDRMENGGFGIVGISGLQLTHLLFEGPVI